MPKALGHPYPGEVLRTAQEVAEKLRPFYESANFSMFKEALQSTLNNRLHRNLACVIDKSSRGAKLKRAFEELP